MDLEETEEDQEDSVEEEDSEIEEDQEDLGEEEDSEIEEEEDLEIEGEEEEEEEHHLILIEDLYFHFYPGLLHTLIKVPFPRPPY